MTTLLQQTTQQQIVYLNGEFKAIEEAQISVLDRGFIFGDGVYEVIPVYAYQVFRFAEHMKRLEQSLREIRLFLSLTAQQWQDILDKLIEKNKHLSAIGDLSIYLHITRGVAPRDHAFPPKEVAPTIFIMCHALHPVSDKIREQGVEAISLVDNRWLKCHIKAISLLPNILLRQTALDQGAQEAILLRDGFVTEGAASNLFVVKNDNIFTPEKSSHLLPGITRDLVVELAQANHIAIFEQPISEQQLNDADEIWLTSSTKEILSVTCLDGKKVADGKPGPMWAKLTDLYQQYKQQIREIIN